jgi:hypothetical protein
MGRNLAGPHRHHQARLPPRHIELWSGAELDERRPRTLIQRCQHQQFEMLTWGKELPPPEAAPARSLDRQIWRR